MTTAQVVETSVTVTNSSFQNYTHPDDHTTRTTDTPGFKPFTIIYKSKHDLCESWIVEEHFIILDTSILFPNVQLSKYPATWNNNSIDLHVLRHYMH